MSIPDEDLGIETFTDVYNSKYGPKEEETTVEWAGRQAARTSARVGETLAGLPGDINQLGQMGAEWLGDKARSWLGKEPLTEEQKEELRQPRTFDLLGKIVNALPTSSSLREGVTQRYTGNYLEPQNDMERFSDEVASDFAALALPVKGKIPFARALGQSVIANSGAEVVKAFGGEEKDAAYTKMGLLFGLGMLSGGKAGGVKKYMNGLYDDMRASIPEGAEVSSKSLLKKLDNIESVLRKGDPKAASKQPALQKIEAIRNKAKSGMVDVDEVIQLTKDTNEAIYGLGELKRGQNQLYRIRDALHDTTKEYGASNPEFLKNWKNANQAYAATETSRKIGNWIKKNVSPKEYIFAASALGLEGSLLGAPASLTALGGAGALGATAYSAEILKRIAKSPALRKHYANVLTNSLNENKAGMIRAMKQLDDGLEKDFENEPFQTIEFEEDIEEIQP